MGDSHFKERADYIVKELIEVQEKNGDGYLVALNGAREKFNEVAQGRIRSASFDLNEMWSPWCTEHRQAQKNYTEHSAFVPFKRTRALGVALAPLQERKAGAISLSTP